ncbi:hypothetical protein MTR67_035133, partial [Solanum verrucosum]
NIFQLPKISFSESNGGTAIRIVDRSTVRQSPSVAPHLESLKIRYWNPHSISLRINSTVCISIYGPSMVTMVPHLVRFPSFAFHALAADLRPPSTERQWTYGP